MSDDGAPPASSRPDEFALRSIDGELIPGGPLTLRNTTGRFRYRLVDHLTGRVVEGDGHIDRCTGEAVRDTIDLVWPPVDGPANG